MSRAGTHPYDYVKQNKGKAEEVSKNTQNEILSSQNTPNALESRIPRRYKSLFSDTCGTDAFVQVTKTE